MRTARVFCAGVVVGVSTVGAIWLFTYQVSSVFRFIDLNGNEFHPARVIHVQPWWSVFGAFALLFLGAVTAIWLLPERPRVLARFANFFSSATANAEGRQKPMLREKKASNDGGTG